MQTDYNLINWLGNTTAYMRANLDTRGPEYLGTCQDMSVSCVATSNDTTPYNCTLLANNATVGGNITSSPEYRSTCELPCDRQLDCNTLCECYDSCGKNQVGWLTGLCSAACCLPAAWEGARPSRPLSSPAARAV